MHGAYLLACVRAQGLAKHVRTSGVVMGRSFSNTARSILDLGEPRVVSHTLNSASLSTSPSALPATVPEGMLRHQPRSPLVVAAL